MLTGFVCVNIDVPFSGDVFRVWTALINEFTACILFLSVIFVTLLNDSPGAWIIRDLGVNRGGE